ncbi:hypothetical protein Ga0100231_003975 [Opitutaceae bacterium TAV4]|nr:hypothetical protein Ga0100231_003975 [Opitutaceae bacterium TAV4]
MPTLLLNFKNEARSAILDLLWRQWITLGVSGHAAQASGKAILDPEALLLASTTLGRMDARLFDEMLDWLQDQADWINLQRLARLHKDHVLGDASILSVIATRLARLPAHKKWKAMEKSSVEVSGSPAPLFPEDGHFGTADQDFLAGGWLRGPVRYRGLSVAPRMDHPGNLLLKLRALFGRQSRAEVMAWLLAHEAGHPAEIARQIGYFRRSVQITLNELERSGHVRSLRKGREKHFSLLADEWRFLATWPMSQGPTFPAWVPWSEIFRLLEQLNALLNDVHLSASSPELQAIEWRRRLDYTLLGNSTLPVLFSLPINARGDEALMAHCDRFRQLLDHLGAGPNEEPASSAMPR